MPRRHTLTDAELRLIQEGLTRLAAETATAQRAPHITPEARKQLLAHAVGIQALAARMQETQRGRDYPNYATDRERQKLRRQKSSLLKRLAKRQVSPQLVQIVREKLVTGL